MRAVTAERGDVRERDGRRGMKKNEKARKSERPDEGETLARPGWTGTSRPRASNKRVRNGQREREREKKGERGHAATSCVCTRTRERKLARNMAGSPSQTLLSPCSGCVRSLFARVCEYRTRCRVLSLSLPHPSRSRFLSLMRARARARAPASYKRYSQAPSKFVPVSAVVSARPPRYRVYLASSCRDLRPPGSARTSEN